MIEKIVKNLENEELFFEDMQYLLFTEDECINNLYSQSTELNSRYHKNINLETKFFYPMIFSVQSNCPTCGYQTPESHRQYNSTYIESVIKYNIDVIKSYDIKQVNCLCIDNNKNYERELFLKILNKYDIDKAIKIDNINELNLIKKYDFDSLIIDSNNINVFNFIQEDKNITKDYKIILNLNIYNNNIENNLKTINNLKNQKIDSVELVGYDPFFDDIHEYNPQYTREYLKRVISILRIMYPPLELKISYATNAKNYFEDTLKLGINSINGIYCNKTNKLYNIENVNNIIHTIHKNKKK